MKRVVTRSDDAETARLRKTHTDVNDCVHVFLSKDSAQIQSSRAPARKYPVMRLGTFALLERWKIDAVWILRETVSMRGRLNSTSTWISTIACTSCRAKAQAPMQPPRDEDAERISVRSGAAKHTMSA